MKPSVYVCKKNLRYKSRWLTQKIILSLQLRQRRTLHHLKLSRLLKRNRKFKVYLSSLIITSYQEIHNEVDAEKVAAFIRKDLKSSIASGTMIQIKRKGAYNRIKLAASHSSGADSAAKPEGAEMTTYSQELKQKITDQKS